MLIDRDNASQGNGASIYLLSLQQAPSLGLREHGGEPVLGRAWMGQPAEAEAEARARVARARLWSWRSLGGGLWDRSFTVIGFANDPQHGWSFYRVLNSQGQIQRPGWSGRWAQGVGPGLSRNHIIPYQLISEALTNVYIAMYRSAAVAAQYGVTPAVAAHQAISALSEISDALYPSRAGTAQNAFAEYTQMVNERTALVTAITTVANYAAPTANEQSGLASRASALEVSLASAPQNVRAGNANMNLRIGANSDPVLQGGLGAVPNALAGPIANVPTTPWAWNVPNQLGGTWSAGGNTPLLAQGSTFYALEEMANAIVYRFMSVAYLYLGHDITLARNDDPHNLIPNYPLNAPLSSSPLPPGAGNQPLLAFDPAGGNLPYRFG
jgi:hypothetical protein